MKKAIELAKQGTGYTKPNPLVGAIIVKGDRIIGEGFHENYGGAHAEINAFNNAIEEVKGCTMYVTLEPCSHYGKTPPCVDAIIERGISRVVIGMKDPNPLVAGKGIEKLKGKGIEVVTGVLEDEVQKLNEIFIKYITTKKPFCIMKTAMTLDGKISTYTGDSMWISNELSRRYVHKLRHQISSIMVGIGTVLADNPQLTTRIEGQEGIDPLRIIVDSQARIPLDSKVLNLKSNAKTLIVTTDKADYKKLEDIKEKGGQVLITPTYNNHVDLEFLMRYLGEQGIDSVLVEGGANLNYSLLNERLIDKVISFVAPKIVGGNFGKTPVGGEGIPNMSDAIQLERMEFMRFKDDIMIEGYIRK